MHVPYLCCIPCAQYKGYLRHVCTICTTTKHSLKPSFAVKSLVTLFRLHSTYLPTSVPTNLLKNVLVLTSLAHSQPVTFRQPAVPRLFPTAQRYILLVWSFGIHVRTLLLRSFSSPLSLLTPLPSRQPYCIHLHKCQPTRKLKKLLHSYLTFHIESHHFSPSI